jgi:alpha-glucoside transport system permease protein
MAAVAVEHDTHDTDLAPTLPNPDDRLSAKLLRFAAKLPVHIFLIVVAILWLVPTIGLLATSLLAPADFNNKGWWQVLSSPSKLTWDNYDSVLHNSDITSALWTTLQIALGGTIVPIIIAALAAYAFAWLEFPGRDWLFLLVIALLVVPLQMALIPIFTLYNNLNLFDTVFGLVLFHTAFALPFAIFLLRNFFLGIPKDVFESARIDGASEMRIFIRLVLPLGLPAIASLAIFQFLWTWNDLLVALVYGRNTQPITVAIYTNLRQFGSNIDLIAPASFLSLAIPLAVFLAFQRYFVQGLLAGSVK